MITVSFSSLSYRYTEWVEFDVKEEVPNFDHVLAKELYDHVADPLETENVAGNSNVEAVERELAALLRNRMFWTSPTEGVRQIEANV